MPVGAAAYQDTLHQKNALYLVHIYAGSVMHDLVFIW